CGLDTRIILCNQGAAQILGYESADDLLGNKVVNLVVVDEKKRALKVLKELVSTGRTVNQEFDFKRVDGSSVPVEINASLLKDRHGLPVAIVGMGRDISQRKQTEEVLRNIAEGVSGVTGETFFRTLVGYLTRSLAMDFAFIGEMLEEKQIRTIAVFKDGEIIDNFEYDLADTPCHNVVRTGICSYPKNVAKRFPRDRMLADMGIESYIGTPLTDSAGHTQGVMSVLGRRPIENTELAESMLRIFAVRASAELERVQAEEELRLLHSLTTAINEADTLDDALKFTVEKICDVTGWLLGEVWMPAADGSVLEQEISWHAIENGFVKFGKESAAFVFQPGEGLPGRVWAEKEPIWIKDVSKEKKFLRLKLAKKIGLKAGVGIPVMLNGEVIAVMDFFIKEAREQEERFIDLVSTAAGQLGTIIQKKRADDKVKDSVRRLQSALSGVIGALASTVERRDPYTAGHQQRVAKLGAALAEEMGLPEESIEGLRMAGTLHDLGKIAVPAEILSKPGTISEYEFSIIKNHPQIGYEILKEIEFPWDIARIVHEHHERIDGSGYPQGLSGEDIMLEARIMAVADTVEAMASHRPYRPSLGMKAALEEIQKYKGKLYDADAVDVCIRLCHQKGYEL
ncbi:MAG: HD domain-containing phosphohydrolase, partial [Actinomycetota bacterium]